MSLFWKKEEPMAIEDAKRLAAEQALMENKKQSDSKTCYNHLEAQFLLGYHGVVLKVYLENFKRMNELFGFEYCEELLDNILDYLEQKTRCKVYRYVGVEFIIILRDRTMGEASRLAEQLIDRFEYSWTVENTDCLCSIRLGLCAYPGYATNAGEMLKCLDLAVSRAAEMEGSQYAVYDMKLHTRFLRRQAITRYLSTAFANDEVEVRYRPTYDLKKGKFTRAEFYMRIFVKDVGMVGSSEFLTIAEDTGQIRTVEYYALDRVASTIRQLLDHGTEFESIAIAISPVLLLQGDFLDEVGRLVRTYDIPAGKLAIEIDEYAVSMAYVNVMILMQELASLGVEMILNNFGSGYSGLARILELPVDTLKFDRMFVWQMETDAQSMPVMEGLTQIAKRIGKKLIAEGVETQNQKDLLTKFGCNIHQGFYYAPTLPEKDLISVLNTSLDDARGLVEHEKEELRK
jgi:diguanylate cyclase (GGDEF) domain